MFVRMVRSALDFRRFSLAWLAAAIVSAGTGVASAGEVTASWVKDTRTDLDVFRFSDPGAGQISISNTVAGASTRSSTDPRIPIPGSFEVGAVTLNALGVSSPKSATVATSDDWNTQIVQNAVVPPQTGLVTSGGEGSWNSVITPGTALGTDVAVNYSASANVSGLVPVAPINLIPYSAYTHVSSPWTVSVLPTDPSGGSIRVTDTLGGGSINLAGLDGMKGVLTSDLTVGYQESGPPVEAPKLYSLTITVLPNFTANSDTGGVLVRYLNRDGSENASMESLIRDNLIVDPANGTVSMGTPVQLFDVTFTDLVPGNYLIGSQLNVGVSAVPEPSSLSLILAAAAATSAWRITRRGRQPSTGSRRGMPGPAL